LEFLQKQTYETCQFNQTDCLFSGLNLDTIVQEETPENFTIYG